MKKTFSSLLFCLIFVVTYAQPKRLSINHDTASLVTLKSAKVVENFDVSVKKARPFALNPELQNSDNIAIGDTLQLALFHGKEYLSVIQSKTTDVNGTTVLVAKLTGFRFAYCCLSMTDQSVLVTVDIPERREKYATRFQPQKSTQYLVQLDENKLDILEDGQSPVPDNDALGMSNFLKEKSTRQDNTGLKSAQIIPGENDSAQIDVLVVYTPAAKQWADTYEGGINNTISQTMANCNLVSTNSKLGIKFNLVHSTEMDYHETGNTNIDISELAYGGIPNVGAIRDIVAADLVVLLTNNSDVGGMSLELNDRQGSDEWGYLVSRIQQTSGYVLIHEIGHCLGAGHHKSQNIYPGPTIWNNWSENTWSAGWRWKGDDNNCYCDVMTYPEGFYFSDGITHTQIPYFSDPDINFKGQSAGHTTEANNTRTIQETKHAVASYRETRPPSTPTVYTVVVHDITKDGATSGGYVVNEGTSKVTGRGIVWGRNRLPTLNDNFKNEESGKGSFISRLSGLQVDSAYYIRAYATNSAGTTYGNQVSFIYTAGENRDFITRWQLNEGQDELHLILDRIGEVNYSWETVPAAQSGSGTFAMGEKMVKIDKLPAGKVIRLRIATNYLMGFCTNYRICPYPEVFNPDRENLIDLEQWGTVKWKSMENAFSGCTKLNISATDMPDLSNVTSMKCMFFLCKSLNRISNINKWMVSSVKDMISMFTGAGLFNQYIGDWDVSNVQKMNLMFAYAKTFNMDIGRWNVSKVTDMFSMFDYADAFNSDIGNWVVSNVTNTASMFAQSGFNKDIGKWNVSKVRNMANMFANATSFNQNIMNWDVTSVEDMSGMFTGTYSFNQNIGKWNVSKVKNMSNMFSWHSRFNQDIGTWDVSNVKDMSKMFYLAYPFNQNLGNWNLSKVNNIENMLDNSGMDCYNYSATLSGWNANTNTPDNLKVGANKLQYGNNAVNARTNLTATKKWTITGDACTGTTCDFKTNLIGNKLSDSNLKLYPNPITNELTIEIEDNYEKINFQIINATGQSIYKGAVIDKMVVQTGSFAPGLYLLRFENNNSFEFKKIIKE